MSPVFLAMFQNEMVETGEGVLAVEDMSGKSMEQLLKHIHTGSTDNLNNLKVDVVLQLLNASVKVKRELKNISRVLIGFDRPLSTNFLQL
jgi:fructose-bisphosphate aldolase class 1